MLFFCLVCCCLSLKKVCKVTNHKVNSRGICHVTIFLIKKIPTQGICRKGQGLVESLKFSETLKELTNHNSLVQPTNQSTLGFWKDILEKKN